MRAVVVGAGLGGLSAACHLAGRGHDVVVLERAAAPGGRATAVVAGGHVLDLGPVVITMPGLVDATFAAAGCDTADHLRMLPVDPAYRTCFADGSALAVHADGTRMADEIRAFAGPGEAAAYLRFRAWLTELFAAEFGPFIDRDYDSVLGLVGRGRDLARLVRLGALRRVDGAVRRFFSDDRLVRAFSFQALYAGLSPFDALAMFSVITYMDSVAPVVLPEGGVHALPRALAAAAAGAGADVRVGRAVARITTGPSGRVSGVVCDDGEAVAADVVVCNADLADTYRTLLGAPPPRRVARGTYSPSCLLWVAGVGGVAPPGAAHHNVHFGGPWRASFEALVRRGERMADPSILVTTPTVTDPSLAPPGRSVVYGLEPVPNLDGAVDWAGAGDELRDGLVGRVAALGYPTTDVAVERFLGPRDWAAAGLERGTPFSLAHRFGQSGPFRPANHDHRFPGLVLVGAGTVPGVGVPMVLVSGRLAADRAEREAAGRVGVGGGRRR